MLRTFVFPFHPPLPSSNHTNTHSILGQTWHKEEEVELINLLLHKTVTFHFSLMSFSRFILFAVLRTFNKFSQESGGLLGGKNET